VTAVGWAGGGGCTIAAWRVPSGDRRPRRTRRAAWPLGRAAARAAPPLDL